jgi:phosphotriesterase-related protein
MSVVQTIRGPVDSGALGATLNHEHLNPQPAGAAFERMGPKWYDEQATARADVEALRRVKRAGIDCILDVTPLDLGRQISLFERVAEVDTGVHVVAATGVYKMIPMHFMVADVDTIAEYFLREIQDGIEGSPIHAGIIKLAWDAEYGLENHRVQLEKTARAGARAAKAGGVPLTCHTRAGDRLGTPLLDIFEDEGLDLAAVTIGHTNDSNDLEYIRGLAARGANVGLDRFSMRHDEAERARRGGIAVAMAQAGFAHQTSLGHDGFPIRIASTEPNLDCWLPVPTVEVPWMLAHGATRSDVDAMLTTSIRRTFEAAAAMARRKQAV